ncbi:MULTISPECIES: GntR family transcriptional regulator [unclassified Oceanispirochaeta]|uniref:GntR family transcriptional regulator n=1 Tax=unclassified Oceanispirochaeta TaxID=2635722 RepID=UPI000E097ABF|nr:MULTISPECIES: GntR family transcriptional regulator [unclassified Oceanispirochaeta]MBF9017955.1 GntR family transcriptional regulator [Oceanispirochaeta sp. M2]NPD74466.1 GntR family transcriptional regulator [Oceanispirochaeta sp. M1]RDG29675.1 GntR family transcriptional regulator [Oceanispirochaeta sp. M1]
MEPAYFLVKQAIEQKIEEQEYKVGDYLPCEKDLGEIYNVSRTTIRKAVSMLVREGKLTIIRGKGTQVAPTRMSHNIEELMSFTELMRKQGMIPAIHDQFAKLEAPSPKLAVILGVKPEGQVFHIQRVRFADEQPISINTSYIKAEYIKGFHEKLIENEQSLYRILKETYNIVIHDTEDCISAISASKEQAEVLNVGKGAPLLFIERRAYDQKNNLIEYSEIYIRSDRYKHIIKMRKN